MPFKKLHSEIKEVLESLEISTPTSFQSKSIAAIKSGANIFCIAPENSGKTTTLILTAMQKLKCEEIGTAPRAIILVGDNEKAKALYETFVTYTRRTSLRVYVCDEKLHIDMLKSEIFEGSDVLIGTTKIMNKLFLLNGVNTTQLKMMCIDDAGFLNQKTPLTAMMAITQSITKCQFVIYSDKMHPFLKKFESYFMKHARTIAM
ncbi:MAG: superfamily II DNA/RNA helicase [Paraglaciecola sp.]|jgi:superfamily II DNA/RNA helicase|uniref:DEAD/DEAH box helicase n=1 Tax=Polaribacter sp. TaxID=1920175 RepID=UPI003AD959BF